MIRSDARSPEQHLPLPRGHPIGDLIWIHREEANSVQGHLLSRGKGCSTVANG